jgi:hypothetical protein
MTEYIDITQSTVFIGMVGLIAPFLFPFVFNLFKRWVGREATSQEKRMVITGFSILVSVGILAFLFEWDGTFFERLWAFVLYMFVNFITLKGVIQSVYELIIKNFPIVEERLDKIES